MRKLSCYIVDDEQHCIDRLKADIEKTPGLQLAGWETNPLIALEQIRNGKITADITFVDVEMTKLTGLELAELIRDKTFIIFVTGFAEYAIDAFDVHAVDFLKKPYDYKRFLEAVGEVQKKMALNKDTVEQKDYFFIKTNGKGSVVKVLYRDILFIESKLNYVNIRVTDKDFITYLTLKETMEQLPANDFVQVHRSFMVNLNRVKALEGYNILLDNGTSVILGESYRKTFMDAISPALLESRRKR